ncbi:Ibr domain protein (macronuclear) [Tetrahymena thermophila SB210]|uniref:Ibr domain protein n=1 Tax=Tetrahymena thermophila (strain SB210) TaxID=312017 RepID=I7M409_TETTS|nr:Ibr domain protein [Tetrahymena thermophila SB210]EAS04679.1 Ibr domain protein [Tetrahymena thermophila SB210]|eukprot:XP_001024924.1 Ibr domain protein [Tetrahymena thermophila SB210]
MKPQKRDQKILLQLKEQINDPADSFFLGLALKKEQKNHKSMSQCLEYLNELIVKVNDKQKQLNKQDDQFWKLSIYYDYLQEVDTDKTCYQFLQKYIDLPKDDTDKDWNTEQTEGHDNFNHSFQAKKQRQNTLSSRNSGHFSPSFMRERKAHKDLENSFEPNGFQKEKHNSQIENQHQQQTHSNQKEKEQQHNHIQEQIQKQYEQTKQNQIDQHEQNQHQQPYQQYEQIEPQTCCKCQNKIHQSDILQLVCEHSYHVNCFKKEASALLEQEIFPIKCLENDCINIPNMDQMGCLLDKRNFQLYQDSYEKYHTNQGRIIKCPNNNCRQKMLYGKPKEKFAKCIFCSQEICLICYRIRHNGLDCEQVLMLNPKQIEEIAAQNKQKMNKECPKCKIVHRNEDCLDQLRCVCGTKFCCTCLKDPSKCNCSAQVNSKSYVSNHNANISSYSYSQPRQQNSIQNNGYNDYQAYKNKSGSRIRSTDQSKNNLRSMNTTYSQINDKQNTHINATNPSSPQLLNEFNNKNGQQNNIQKQQTSYYPNNLSQSRDFYTENNTNYYPDTTITRYNETNNNQIQSINSDKRANSPPYQQNHHYHHQQYKSYENNRNNPEINSKSNTVDIMNTSNNNNSNKYPEKSNLPYNYKGQQYNSNNNNSQNYNKQNQQNDNLNYHNQSQNRQGNHQSDNKQNDIKQIQSPHNDNQNYKQQNGEIQKKQLDHQQKSQQNNENHQKFHHSNSTDQHQNNNNQPPNQKSQNENNQKLSKQHENQNNVSLHTNNALNKNSYNNSKSLDQNNNSIFENNSATFTPPEQSKQQANEHTPIKTSQKKQQMHSLHLYQDGDNQSENPVTFGGERHIPKVKEIDPPLLSSRSTRNSQRGGGVVPMVVAQPSQQNNQGTPYKSLQFSKYNLPKLNDTSSSKRGVFVQNTFTNQQMNENFENNLSQRSNNTQMQKSIFDDENQQSEEGFRNNSYLAESRFKSNNSFIVTTTPRNSSQQERRQTPQRGISPYRQQQYQHQQGYDFQPNHNNPVNQSSGNKEQYQKIKV